MNAVVAQQSNALTVEERAKQALVITKTEKELKELAERSATITAITNADGYQQVHQARMTLKGARVEIQKLGKAAREDAQKFAKAVITEEKRLVELIEPEEERLAALQKGWDDAIEAEKQRKIQAELDRVNALQERVAELRGNQRITSLSDPTLIAEHVSYIERIAVDESFEEFQQQAQDAKAAGLARLRDLYAAAVARVAEDERIKAERAELARLRAADEERRAAERARLAEEERQAKQDREAEAARQAEELRRQREENERKAAEERERLRADQQRLDAERAEFERRQREQQRIRDEEEAARAENARIAALKKPSDDELIAVLCDHYRAPADKVVDWLRQMVLPA
jgi:hypothetical protein